MDDKEAIRKMTDMLKKYSFNDEEIEAIKTAVGILAWTKLIDSKIETHKQKRTQKNAIPAD